ncbi:hypothetical protein Tco_1325660 [Tanacetum coccineum]
MPKHIERDVSVECTCVTLHIVELGETRADVSAPDWSAYNIIVPSEADQSFADQSETDTSALVPSLSCALGAHVRKAL